MSRNPFLEMLTAPEQEIPGTFWATVTATNPLRVKRDTEPVLPVTPQTLANLAVGDRVLCLWERRQVVVLGRMGGPGAENTIRIGGVDYALSGSVPCPSFSWSGQTSTTTANAVFYGSITVPVPYSPPSGYTFQWSVGESARRVFVGNAERVPSGGTQNIRVMQIASAATDGLTRLNWRLVKL